MAIDSKKCHRQDVEVAMPKTTPGTADSVIERQLDLHLQDLEKQLIADVLAFCGGIHYGVDDLIRDAIEDKEPKQPKVVLILETPGGYIEVV